MKILYYQKGAGQSGAERGHVREICNNLEALGHTVINKPVDAPPAAGVARGPRLGRIQRAFMGEFWILHHLVTEIRLLLKYWKLVNRNRPDIIYSRHSWLNSEWLIGRIFSIPVAREVNGIVALDLRAQKKPWHRIPLVVVNWVESISLRMTDIVISPGHVLADYLVNHYRVKPGRVVETFNGVNTELFAPAAHNGSFLRVGFVGSLWKAQGVEYFIKAIPSILEDYPDASFLIVGDGELKPGLEGLARALRVKKYIQFTGFVPYESVPSYINICDVMVAPFIRERNEKLGLSALKLCEYSACGKPIIASRIPDLEYIEQNRIGFLVEPQSPGEIADAVCELLGNPGIATTVGQRGRDYVIRSRSWAMVALKLSDAFESAVGTKALI